MYSQDLYKALKKETCFRYILVKMDGGLKHDCKCYLYR
jgi:hypothetical protein